MVYGSAGGLDTAKRQIIHQDSPDVPGAAEAGDQFGYSTAAGDYNGDGYDDLIVGRPYSSGVSRGAISVRPGSSGGLSKTRYYTVSQNTSGVPGAGEGGDGFGVSVLLDGTGSGVTTSGARAFGSANVGGPGKAGWFAASLAR